MSNDVVFDDKYFPKFNWNSDLNAIHMLVLKEIIHYLYV